MENEKIYVNFPQKVEYYELKYGESGRIIKLG